MRVVQISDTHVSARGGVPRDNLGRVIDHVNDRLGPDLVVVSGDLVALDPDEAADRTAAHEVLGSLRAPVRVIPGNHDVGDVGERPWMGLGVTASRVAAFRDVWGADRWAHAVDGWTVVGINSQVLGSGLPDEDEQWRWLADVAAEGSGPVLLFSHVPPLELEPGLPAGTTLGAASRERVLGTLGDRLRAIGAGHLHTYRQERRHGVEVVWGPATAMISGPGRSPGIVVWDLNGDARASFEEVPGLEAHELRQIPVLAEQLAQLEARAAAEA